MTLAPEAITGEFGPGGRLRLSWVMATAVVWAFALGVVLYDTRYYFFFSDDFLNFIIARDMGLGRPYLFRDVFGQFIPLYRLGFLAYWHLFGLRFWPFRLLLVLFVWSATLVLVRIAARRRAPLPVLFPVLVLLVASPIFVTTFQWWSAALSVLGAALSLLVAIWLAAEGGAMALWRKLVLAAIYLGALMLYPKALFAIVLILAVRVFVGMEDCGLRLRTAAWRGAGDLWPMLAVFPGYLAIVYFGGYDSGVTRPDGLTLLKYVWEGWNDGFLARSLGLDTEFCGALVAANVLMVLCVAVSVWRNPRSMVLWAGFVLYFAISVAAIGWNRAVPFGVKSADTGRYYADILCFFVAKLAIALGGRRSDARPQPRAGTAAAIVATCLGAAHLLRASQQVPHLWFAGPERPALFVRNVRTALTQAGTGERIANTVVPSDIMPSWTWPLNQYQYFLPLFRWHGQVVRRDNATVEFSESGTLTSVKR